MEEIEELRDLEEGVEGEEEEETDWGMVVVGGGTVWIDVEGWYNATLSY